MLAVSLLESPLEVDNLISYLQLPEMHTVALPDNEIALILELKTDQLINSDKWLVLRLDEMIVGFVRWNYFTSITAIVHGYLQQAYWGTSISDEFDSLTCKWFAENTHVHKLSVLSPAPCKHVHLACARWGYEIEGVSIGAIVWRNRVEHLVIMSKFIRKDTN